ncbi:hypothetical protein LLG07_04810 [bacterium]|nr:hypothetical protein [bacterium]
MIIDDACATFTQEGHDASIEIIKEFLEKQKKLKMY